MRIRYIGESYDGRTNRWSLTCNCNYTWEPRTTMFSCERIQCPSCGDHYFVNYNEQKAKKV